MRELTVAGTYFDIGYQIGVFGRKAIKRLLRKSQPLIKVTLAQEGKWESTIRLLKARVPHLLLELKGMATGADVSFNELLARHCPEITGAYGCTTVVVKNKVNFFVAHNEDDESWLTADSYALINYQLYDGCRYTAFVILGDLPGSAFSWNAAGLFFAVDAMVQQQPARLTGLPRHFQNAILIEQATLANAVDFLKRTPSASSDHYLIADMNNKKAVSVEKSGNQISAQDIRGLYVHTNHFIHPKFRSGYQGGEYFGTSKERLAIAEKIFKKNDDIEAVIRKLTTKLKRPLRPEDLNKTWATVVCCS